VTVTVSGTGIGTGKNMIDMTETVAVQGIITGMTTMIGVRLGNIGIEKQSGTTGRTGHIEMRKSGRGIGIGIGIETAETESESEQVTRIIRKRGGMIMMRGCRMKRRRSGHGTIRLGQWIRTERGEHATSHQRRGRFEERRGW
jgi:hypothetical protein